MAQGTAPEISSQQPCCAPRLLLRVPLSNPPVVTRLVLRSLPEGSSRQPPSVPGRLLAGLQVPSQGHAGETWSQLTITCLLHVQAEPQPSEMPTPLSAAPMRCRVPVLADSAAGTCHDASGELAPADRQPIRAMLMSMLCWQGAHRDTCDECCMVEFVAMASCHTLPSSQGGALAAGTNN